MNNRPSIFQAALSLAVARVDAERALLAVVLADPAHVAARLREVDAMPACISQDDYRVMLTVALTLHPSVSRVDALLGVRDALKDAGLWEWRGPAGNGLIWCPKGLVRFSSWFNPGCLAAGANMAAGEAVRRWNRVAELNMRWREAVRCADASAAFLGADTDVVGPIRMAAEAVRIARLTQIPVNRIGDYVTGNKKVRAVLDKVAEPKRVGAAA